MRISLIMLVGTIAIAFTAVADETPVGAAAPAVPVANPDDCWVELYDEPTLEGDKVRLKGPLTQSKLADLEYSNGENLNDDVRGVRTGPTARVELFDKADLGGHVHRIYENQAEKLDDGNIGEESSSLRITCIDLTPPVSAGVPTDCWVELYDEPTLEGDNVKLAGPIEQADLAKYEYANGENLNKDVRGVKTGPLGRVELYSKANFEGQVYRVFPSSNEAIDSSGFGEKAESIRVTCGR
jgi:hypothetical protein